MILERAQKRAQRIMAHLFSPLLRPILFWVVYGFFVRGLQKHGTLVTFSSGFSFSGGWNSIWSYLMKYKKIIAIDTLVNQYSFSRYEILFSNFCHESLVSSREILQVDHTTVPMFGAEALTGGTQGKSFE